MSLKMKAGNRKIRISHPDKVLFPESGITKAGLVEYYLKASRFMVPHMRYCGLSMHRFPDGIKEKGFYQKDAPDYYPDWIRTVRMKKKNGGHYEAPVAHTAATLVYLANLAMITPHLYLAREEKPDFPDRMIFDLDPPEGTTDYGMVREVALGLKDLLQSLGTTPFVMTTGSEGYHVVISLDRRADFDSVREFAVAAGEVLVKRMGDICTLEQRKFERGGKVFIDTLRNSHGATAVAPYALRPLPGAPVAAPLEWSEVSGGVDPRRWKAGSIFRRIAHRADPWKDIRRHAVSLGKRREDLEAMK